MRRAVLLSFAILTIAAAPKTAQQLFDEARAAHERKDNAAYLASIGELAAQRPQHPIVLAMYAGGLALNGRGDEAVAQLQRVVDLHVVPDLTNHDLDGIRERDDFRALARRADALKAQVIGQPELAYALPKELGAESIAYDPKSESFFVSAVTKRKIVRIDRHGRVTDFVPTGAHGLWGGNGLAIDIHRRVLWSTSSRYAKSEGFKEGDSPDPALYAWNADSGAFIARYEPPTDGPHVFDDLSVAPDGTVYVSDATGLLFSLRPGGKELEPLIPRGKIRSAQGQALDAQHHLLYVADYGGALHAVDLPSGDIAHIPFPADFPTVGIDGLAIHGRTLYGVQNGAAPTRIVRFDLTPDRVHIASWRIVAMNHPWTDDPTIGVVARGAYYLVGGSVYRLPL